MNTPRKRPSYVRLVIFVVLEVLILGGCWWGISHETKKMNQAVNEIAELKDPSPFRAALMGYLGKIHLGMEGYLRSSDASLVEQVGQSEKDFEAALPEFERQNPKLFPKAAVGEISRAFGVFKEALDQTLSAHAKRAVSRAALEKNFARIVFLIEHSIRPLIRDAQADSEERSDAILNVENQARAWQQNLNKAWLQPAQGGLELTFENDNRGASYLERYARMELLSRERKVFKEVLALWQTTSDMARSSFPLEKIVNETEKFMNSQREQVVRALNKYLPAMPPAELEARKQAYVRSIRLHSAALVLLVCLIFVSLAAFAVAAYRMTPRGAAEHQAAVQQAAKKEALAHPTESTLEMDLKGMITKWSSSAEALYGYTAGEMHGRPVSKLFESESEIARLYKDLVEAPQTSFQTTHRTKDGTIIRVRIEFRPVNDPRGHSSGIGLVCSRK